jgi:GMP synthase-like glutamine amidotransferase
VSSTTIDLTEEGKRIFPTLGDKMSIMQMHKDYVAEVPLDSVLLCVSDVCHNQGFYKPGAYITLQGHPEFNGFIIRDIVETRKKLGVFDDETANEYIKRSTGPNDGSTIAKSLVEFLVK